VAFVDLSSPQPIRAVTAAGRLREEPSARSGAWSLAYLAPPAAGFELTVELAAGATLEVNAIDMTYGLPDQASPPLRSAGAMPSLDAPTDARYVRRSFQL
jgi:hypothetical protein